MSTSSELSALAQSLVGEVEVEDGYRVASPTGDEVEALKALLDGAIREVIQMPVRSNA